MQEHPKYPVYIISKGRYENCLTAQMFVKDNVPFYLVVEPQEKQEYADRFGVERIIVLPFSNLGLGSIPARNFVKEHSTKNGNKRHWIFDDNIRNIRRMNRGKRIICNGNAALIATEDFTDRYENIAIAGLNYTFFAITKLPPFYLNCHVYSCLLILNELPYNWRGRYNEDTDLCLQVLSGGWCTVSMNAFLIDKMATMTMKGGNTDVLYKEDGRLTMAKSLERMWPGVVKVGRRYDRPQHVVKGSWKNFDTQLIRRKDIDWDALKPNNFGMKLVQVKEVQSEELKRLVNNDR
jgi:hypothetical protein